MLLPFIMLLLGSGKTYTIVKDCRLLFQSKMKLTFRNILTLTLPIKQLVKMKARIIDIKAFSDEAAHEKH
jgi:hypothetical protein